MSVVKYNINELKNYALNHTVIECADHYNIKLNSMYTLLNSKHIEYKKTRKRGLPKITHIPQSENTSLIDLFGLMKPKTKLEGWALLALGVILYARIDKESTYSTRPLMERMVLDYYYK